MQQWGAERIEELAALVAAALPEEDLTSDELLTALYDQPGMVIGPREGSGVVAVGLGRDLDGVPAAAVRLVATHPDLRGAGHGSALLEAAESWAAEGGAERIELGGLLPFALWPGVEVDGALARLAGRLGYSFGVELLTFGIPTSFRAAAPEGVAIRRAVSDDDVTAVVLAVASSWPRHSVEVARALDHGTCHAAFATTSTDPDGRGGEIVGIGCHSITRAAWAGPLVVRPAARRRGVGRALLGQICRDLMIADFPLVEVPGVPVDDATTAAFLMSAGADLRRTWRTVSKSLGT